MLPAQEYLDSLRNPKPKVYMFGRRVENLVDHPVFRPSINSVAKSYELAEQPEYQEPVTGTSNMTGHRCQ